jgi:hypothetical protein
MDFEDTAGGPCSALVAAGTETTSPHRHFTFFPTAVSGTFNDTPQLEHLTIAIDESSFCRCKKAPLDAHVKTQTSKAQPMKNR